MIRVPVVLQPSIAVFQRLDIGETHEQSPPGASVGTTGYNRFFREPIVYDDDDGNRTSTRQYVEVKVPCQVEAMSAGKLQQMYNGPVDLYNIMLILRREDLELADLITEDGNCAIKRGDMVTHLERFGTSGVKIRTFPNGGIYVEEVRPASWGFGPDGYDLELVLLTERRQGA